MKATNKELGRVLDFMFDTFLQGSDIEAGTPSSNQERDADMESFLAMVAEIKKDMEDIRDKQVSLEVNMNTRQRCLQLSSSAIA